MARSSETHGLECAEIAARAGAARRPVGFSLGGVLKLAAGTVKRALAAVEAAVAGLLFWHDVSRRIEGLLILDDASLRRRGLERNEVVPTVFQAARARWDLRHDCDPMQSSRESRRN
jgi:hypothetical protein